MKWLSLVSRVLKAVALVANGMFVPAALLMCPLLMVADAGPLLWPGVIWLLLCAAGAVTVMLALGLPENRRWFVRLAYPALVLPFGFAVTCWVDHFNISGRFAPPGESGIVGGLALVDVLALATNRPLYLSFIWQRRKLRYSALAGLIALGF